MLLLDFHRVFRKTGKKINVIKFQKVEFLCVIQLYILFLKLFSIIGYYKILIIVPCSVQ